MGAAALFGTALDRESLWIAEAHTLHLAKDPVGKIIGDYVSTNTEGPPAFKLLLRAWISVAGESETALRLLSVLSICIGIWIQCVLVRRLFGARVAVVAGVLMATSSSLLYFAQESRSYAFLVLLYSISAYVFVGFVNAPCPRRALLLGSVDALALLTHAVPVALVAAELVVLLALRRRTTRALRLWLVGHVVFVPLLLPYLRFPEAADKLAVDSWLPLPNANSAFRTVELLSGARVVANPVAAIQLPPSFQSVRAAALFFLALAFALLGLGTLLRARGPGADRDIGRVLIPATLLLILGVPVAVSFLALPFYVPRYLIMAAPGFLTLTALGVTALRRRPAILAVTLAIGVLGFDRCLEELRLRTKDDWRGAAALVSSEIRPGDGLIVSDGAGIFPFQYYYSGPVEPVPVRGDVAQARPRKLVLAELGSSLQVSRLFLVMPWGGSSLFGFLEGERRFNRRSLRRFDGFRGGVIVVSYDVAATARR